MRRLIYVLMLVLLNVTACSGDNNNVQRESANVSTTSARTDLIDGETVYNTYCAACHGVNGEGQNPEDPYAPDENGKFLAPPHNNTTGHTWHHGDDVLFQIVNEGGMGEPNFFNEMPAFGELLSDDQIEAVLTYIKTFWTKEQRATQKERTEAVRTQ